MRATDPTTTDFSIHTLMAIAITGVMVLGCDTRPASQPSPSSGTTTTKQPERSPRRSAQNAEPAAAKPAAAKPVAAKPAAAKPAAAKPAAAKPDSAYVRDIRAICFAEEDSGALEANDYERTMIVAQWLGKEVKSEAGRAFLAQLARTKGPEKGALLAAAGRQAGLARCPLAAAWSGTGKE